MYYLKLACFDSERSGTSKLDFRGSDSSMLLISRGSVAASLALGEIVLVLVIVKVKIRIIVIVKVIVIVLVLVIVKIPIIVIVVVKVTVSACCQKC